MQNSSKYDKIGDLAKDILSRPVEQIINLRIKPHGYGKYICPFHDDHTPNNFKIRPKSNGFHCFACDTYGNGIKFIEYYDGIEWKEAVVKIAKELGLITVSESIELLEINTNFKKKENTNNESKVLFVQKEENKEAIETKITNRDMLHFVYSIFSKGYSLLGKDILTKEHYDELINNRHLSMEDIQEDGYFSFPDLDFLDTFIKEINKYNITEEDLKGVPGFYYSKQKERWAFTLLRNTSGIGIPIKDIDGKIVGIQIRLDKKSDTGKRYQWFSSSFAGGDGSTGAKNIYGSSPGVPVAIVRPKTLKNGTIFITEGYFKARAIANKYHCIALSVQGVNNWKEIPFIINRLKLQNKHHKFVCIAYDGDMGRKDTVMKPALQLGFALSGIQFEENLKKDLDIILKTGNRPLSAKVGNFVESAQKISDILLNEQNTLSIKVCYCLWNETLGKGIDDIIYGQVAETIRQMYLRDFWNNAFNMLKALDEERERLAKENNEDFRKVIVPDSVKTKLYEDYIDSKLKK